MTDLATFKTPDTRQRLVERVLRFGKICPQCRRRPLAPWTMLLPGEQCPIDGYRDPRPEGME